MMKQHGFLYPAKSLNAQNKLRQTQQHSTHKQTIIRTGRGAQGHTREQCQSQHERAVSRGALRSVNVVSVRVRLGVGLWLWLGHLLLLINIVGAGELVVGPCNCLARDRAEVEPKPGVLPMGSSIASTALAGCLLVANYARAKSRHCFTPRPYWIAVVTNGSDDSHVRGLHRTASGGN